MLLPDPVDSAKLLVQVMHYSSSTNLITARAVYSGFNQEFCREKILLTLFVATVAFVNTSAADTQSVLLIKSMGLKVYACAYTVAKSLPEVPEIMTMNTTIFAVDKQSALANCYNSIGAQIFGNDGDRKIHASNTNLAPNKFVPVLRMEIYQAE